MNEETKIAIKRVRVVLIILAAFLAIQALTALKALKGVDPVYNSISVTGEGEAVSIPDVANLSFAVTSDGKTVGEAQEKVTTKMDAILTDIKALGVEEKDIKTTNYSVYPKYQYEPIICNERYCPPTKQVPDGYTANHYVSIKIRKIEDAGKVLAAAGENGATEISGISFVADDPDKVVQEARALAIKDAQERAKVLARELGVRIVRVVSYYDNYGGGPIPFGEAMGMGGDAVRSTAVPAKAPTLPTGENKIVINVTVTYEIR